MPGRTRDLRRAQRKPKRQAAWISCGDTPALIQCVIWDLTEGGARLASARLNRLPDLFTLNFTKDGKSSRFCRVVWRKKPHVGVEFIDSTRAAELEARYARGRPLAGTAQYLPVPLDGVPGSLPLALQASNAPGRAAAPTRGTISSFSFGLLLLLFVATALFYVAGMQLREGTPWAMEVCDYARDFCENPGWSGVPAAIIGIVFLAVKRMEI
ncbi:MAG TPA: hypothetical protein VIH98_11265 [Xanthobacteraceae bacterium]